MAAVATRSVVSGSKAGEHVVLLAKDTSRTRQLVKQSLARFGDVEHSIVPVRGIIGCPAAAHEDNHRASG